MLEMYLCFFLIIRRPPRSTPFLTTTLSRSRRVTGEAVLAPPLGCVHRKVGVAQQRLGVHRRVARDRDPDAARDRKSTRLNSSHANISYAVFCLKKKTNHRFHTVLTHL